jgi:hypothetical protein
MGVRRTITVAAASPTVCSLRRLWGRLNSIQIMRFVESSRPKHAKVPSNSKRYDARMVAWFVAFWCAGSRARARFPESPPGWIGGR